MCSGTGRVITDSYDFMQMPLAALISEFIGNVEEQYSWDSEIQE